jgi:hypothetical protein
MEKLHNEELHNLYSSPNTTRQIKSKRMRRTGHVARKGDERTVYTVFVGKPEGKRPLGKPRGRWDYGVRRHLRETVWKVWSGFSWLRIGTSGELL